LVVGGRPRKKNLRFFDFIYLLLLLLFVTFVTVCLSLISANFRMQKVAHLF